jgi:hypothetical protein
VEKVGEDTNFVWTQLKIAECFKKQPRSACKFRLNRENNSSSCLWKKESSTAVERSHEANLFNRNIMCGEDLWLW